MIWFFCDAAYAGGAEQYVATLLRGLGPTNAGLVAMDREGMASFFDTIRQQGFEVETLQGASLPAAWFALAKWLRRRRPALLHVNLPGPYDGLMATAAAVGSLVGGCPVVVTEHLPTVPSVGKRAVWKRLWCGKVDRIVALCQAHVSVLEQQHGYRRDRIRIVPNGVSDPLERFRTRPTAHAAERLHLLQVGALDDRKGGKELIELLSHCAGTGLRVRLTFAGEGPARSRWETRAAELGIEQYVDFLGHRADIVDQLLAADVVVLHSRREGMPLSLLEAMACARPIVATPVDGIPEMLDFDQRQLAGFGQVDQWERVLRPMAEEARLRSELGDANRARYLERYRFETQLEATRAVYAELLA